MKKSDVVDLNPDRPQGMGPTFIVLGLGGFALIALCRAMAALSSSFAHEIPHVETPILSFVFCLTTAGVLYFLVTLRPRCSSLKRVLMMWVVLTGLVTRLLFFGSEPVLEDDHYRYLWDGALVARGYNPYRYAPAQIQAGPDDHIPETIRRLADESGPVIERINYPWLRTIYPPVTQGVFALAHMVAPWNLDAWRLILLVFDAVTALLLIRLLKRLRLPSFSLIIYWWNPLLIREIYNAGHMEVIIFPFVLGALLLSLYGKHLLASFALGLSVGTKIWPVLLLPVFLKPLYRESRRFFTALAVFTITAVLALLPLLSSRLDTSSGFMAYGRTWEMNDTLFMALAWCAGHLGGLLGFEEGSRQIIARAAAAMILLLWICRVVGKQGRDPVALIRSCLMIIAGAYFLSPTQFPWYYLWMLPFLALGRSAPLLALTFLLPLYYLRYYFNARGMVKIFDQGLVWLEFLPVWAWLLWEACRGRWRTP